MDDFSNSLIDNVGILERVTMDQWSTLTSYLWLEYSSGVVRLNFMEFKLNGISKESCRKNIS